ncbi:MAG: hypothetical protein ACRER2_10900 [Methylococcales bacterium]
MLTDAEGLAQFISQTLEPFGIRMEREAFHQPAIKAQALGEGLQMHRLEKTESLRNASRPQV